MTRSDWTVDPGSAPPLRQAAWFPSDVPPTMPTQPPVAGAPLPPAGPPSNTPSGGRGASRAVASVAIASILTLMIGFGAGRLTSSSSPSEVLAQAAAGATTRQVGITNTPAPLEGNEAEPAAAVAKALAPAAVQLSTEEGLGSGFIYDKSGLILTAAHVVSGNDQMQVRLNDGTLTTGTIVGANEETDIAVVRIDVGHDLPVASLALGKPVVVGQLAVALGSPYGLDQTVTSGIISAVGRAVPTNGNGEVAMLQTDAPINPGNSGGMLANRFGQVIGVNDSIITGSNDSSGTEAGNVGVGFAIPIDLAKSVADRIVAGTPIEFGYLGVKTQTANEKRVGGLIASVEPDSPAAKAGLQADDVVIRVEDIPVGSGSDLAAAVRAHVPGTTVDLLVLRDGKEITLPVTVGKAP